MKIRETFYKAQLYKGKNIYYRKLFFPFKISLQWKEN